MDPSLSMSEIEHWDKSESGTRYPINMTFVLYMVMETLFKDNWISAFLQDSMAHLIRLPVTFSNEQLFSFMRSDVHFIEHDLCQRAD